MVHLCGYFILKKLVFKAFFFLLRGFSNTETLCSEYKYYCEECRSKQEAHKRYIPLREGEK